MYNWIRWQFVFALCSIVITFGRIKGWFTKKSLYIAAYLFRITIMVDFVFGCIALPIKYNVGDNTNFYYLCIYLGFLVVVFCFLCKFLRALKEDIKNDT